MNKNKQIYNKGFAALAIVMLISMLAVFFMMNTTVRGWSQGKNILESQIAAQVRLNAISCINLARLHLRINESSGNPNDEILGTYHLKDGHCDIEDISRQGVYFYVQTKAELQNARVMLHAELGASNFEIVSIQET